MKIYKICQCSKRRPNEGNWRAGASGYPVIINGYQHIQSQHPMQLCSSRYTCCPIFQQVPVHNSRSLCKLLLHNQRSLLFSTSDSGFETCKPNSFILECMPTQMNLFGLFISTKPIWHEEILLEFMKFVMNYWQLAFLGSKRLLSDNCKHPVNTKCTLCCVSLSAFPNRRPRRCPIVPDSWAIFGWSDTFVVSW